MDAKIELEGEGKVKGREVQDMHIECQKIKRSSQDFKLVP